MLNLKNELKGAKSVAISGHIRPDGDCVGSTMAVYLLVKKIMPECDVHIYLEDEPKLFSYIKDYDKIENPQGVEKTFDVFVCLDTVKDRLGNAEGIFDKALKKINIDHHMTNLGCGDVNYIVPDASSASELVYNCIDEEDMDLDIATALFIGIIHDTGVLQYSNTSVSTQRATAKLISYGVEASMLIENTFYSKTYLQTQLLGRVLSESILLCDGRVSVGHIDLKTSKFYNSRPKDYEGIVNQLKYIRGVDVAIFMYEQEDHKYKVSLRSNEKVDVSVVSAYFGGGGHKRASGVTMEGNFYDVVNNLTGEIVKQL